MKKVVSYAVVAKKNPSNPELAPKFYARVKSRGDVTTREMAVRIQNSCTVTKADVMAVLVALEDVIIEALKAGEIVRIAELGSLQIGVSGRGASTIKDFNDSYIDKARINFRPGSVLKEILGSISYTKLTVAEETGEETPKDDGAENIED